ncbi:MAG: signal peptidase [Rhodobacterales bacterium]|nr:MAG: signal peptidase [Rhodobacterales bacterium]
MRNLFFAAALALATPAAADVQSALDDHILPGFAAFTEASAVLAETAATECGAEALAPAYNAAFDAWLAVADIRIGPSETGALSVSFWPDTKGFTRKALNRKLADQDPAALTPERMHETSIAGRGFLALDMLLFDAAYRDQRGYACDLAAAIAADLAVQAKELEAAWHDGFTAVILSAGEAGNTTFLTPQEASNAIYTQVLAGLQFVYTKRVGRPLGEMNRPRPARAEAWRSGRSVANIVGATEAAVSLAEALAGFELPKTQAALERVRVTAAKIEDPTFADIKGNVEAWIKLEALGQRVQEVQDTIMTELGAPMGLKAGFNSQDGD